jgi:hypothetical protein
METMNENEVGKKQKKKKVYAACGYSGNAGLDLQQHRLRRWGLCAVFNTP